VVSRTLAAASTSEALSIPLAPGGALVLYRVVGSALVTLSPTMQRAVMADLTLPLERNRLVALVQHVGERAKTTGRGSAGGFERGNGRGLKATRRLGDSAARRDCLTSKTVLH
jgi:hypothetical protein